MSSRLEVAVIDYGAGNVLSLMNALDKLGWIARTVTNGRHIDEARVVLFPGVGSFDSAMKALQRRGFVEPLKRYLRANRPFLGICIGMQLLFDEGEEGGEGTGCEGLGIVGGKVERFRCVELPVPHIGWNSLSVARNSLSTHEEEKGTFAADALYEAMSESLSGNIHDKFYFVHSYRVAPGPDNNSWVRTVTDYGERFISTVQRGHILGVQFHPEKSSQAGLKFISSFLKYAFSVPRFRPDALLSTDPPFPMLNLKRVIDEARTELSKRIIACLDVRNNDAGDLVVTKGDQYDVREKPVLDTFVNGKGGVRNLGKPVQLARTYYEQGADEITFLNICQFRAEALADLPLLAVLEETSRHVFVPLCVGGGIRDYVDSNGQQITALQIANVYFRSGADKISIGSDAVLAAEEWWARGRIKTGLTSIEQISFVYGAQAVVVSVDPRRVWVQKPEQTSHTCIRCSTTKGPGGEEYCWYQCTIKGGREGRDLDVLQLIEAVSNLGAGEILLNSMDADGQKQGYDLDLVRCVCEKTSLPVIASSGAGTVEHFSQVFRSTNVQAALAAGIFHRNEVPLSAVKKHLLAKNVPVRL